MLSLNKEMRQLAVVGMLGIKAKWEIKHSPDSHILVNYRHLLLCKFLRQQELCHFLHLMWYGNIYLCMFTCYMPLLFTNIISLLVSANS